MGVPDHRVLVDQAVKALNDLDRDRLQAVFAPNLVNDWPQTGRRVRGFDNLWALMVNYPSPTHEAPLAVAETALSHVSGGLMLVAPAFTVISVEGGGNSGTAVWRVRYPDGSYWWAVNMYHLSDGLIDRMTSFFAPEFAAPEWRAQWVERMSP